MKKVKKILKNNVKVLIAFILGGIILGTCGVYAATVINASDVSFKNASSEMTSTNVQGAIEELNTKATTKIAEAKKECPDGYRCEENKLCKRATILHTENCTQTSTSSYCQADGYALNEAISYGNLGTKGTLTSGDAFDCDVNGDGIYNASTERFYYVSDMTNGVTKNSNTAVLIYYNNVSGGVASNSDKCAYDSTSYASGSTEGDGPITAIKQLPTTSQWKNVSLINTTRDITTEKGTVQKAGFSYKGYAARLLTYQEVYNGCYDGTTSITSNKGLSTKCKYLMENTNYSSNSLDSWWLESRGTSGSIPVPIAVYVYSSPRYVFAEPVGTSNNKGVRPAIEVSKTNISY